MKFITEDELRYLYRKEPFTTYKPEPGTRLTPGGRQFLLDRGIDMYDEQKSTPIIRESLTQEICCPSANPGHNYPKETEETQEAPPEQPPSPAPMAEQSAIVNSLLKPLIILLPPPAAGRFALLPQIYYGLIYSHCITLCSENQYR